MISDDKILEGCKAGKRNAYNSLYKRYSDIMLGICFRYCKNRQEAEDVLQEGFIKVFKNISHYRSEGSFEGWMKRIMINAAIDHYQKNLKHSYHDEFDKIREYESVNNEEASFYRNVDVQQDQLMQMIQDLPDGYRIVFNMFAIEGYSHKDIARSLDISENTSKSQLLKARKALRSKLDKYITKQEKILVK